jgi:hypothetical protein
MLAFCAAGPPRLRHAARNGDPSSSPKSRRHRRFDGNPLPLMLIPVRMTRWRTASPSSQKAALRGIMALGFGNANPRRTHRGRGGGVSGSQTVWPIAATGTNNRGSMPEKTRQDTSTMISPPKREPLIKRRISDSELARLLKWRSGPPRPGAIDSLGEGDAVVWLLHCPCVERK